MAIVSEILRFNLPRRSLASSTAFNLLRRKAETNGLVKVQYFGYVLPNEGFPAPKPENQMCWYLEWPEKSEYRTSLQFKQELAAMAGDNPRSLLFEFKQTHSGEILKGLEAPACEFAIINLAPNPPRLDADFEHSMHKTFTDCYFAKGFAGGGWGYALNSNESEGQEITVDGAVESLLQEKARTMAYYIIGWGSIADNKDYAKTELYDVEIDKLKPYFGAGTGTFYVKFERHGSVVLN